MKITRHGSRAYNGSRTIELNKLRFTLSDEGIIIQDSDIKDFVTKAHHDYKIVLSLKEVGEIINSIGSFPDAKKNEIGKALEGQLKKLLRIVQSCVDV